jgi:hypothetical protein
MMILPRHARDKQSLGKTRWKATPLIWAGSSGKGKTKKKGGGGKGGKAASNYAYTSVGRQRMQQLQAEMVLAPVPYLIGIPSLDALGKGKGKTSLFCDVVLY